MPVERYPLGVAFESDTTGSHCSLLICKALELTGPIAPEDMDKEYWDTMGWMFVWAWNASLETGKIQKLMNRFLKKSGIQSLPPIMGAIIEDFIEDKRAVFPDDMTPLKSCSFSQNEITVEY